MRSSLPSRIFCVLFSLLLCPVISNAQVANEPFGQVVRGTLPLYSTNPGVNGLPRCVEVEVDMPYNASGQGVTPCTVSLKFEGGSTMVCTGRTAPGGACVYNSSNCTPNQPSGFSCEVLMQTLGAGGMLLQCCYGPTVESCEPYGRDSAPFFRYYKERYRDWRYNSTLGVEIFDYSNREY